VKFTSDGRKEWQEVVEGTAGIGLRARVTVVAVDSNGFVFVAGTIGNTDSAGDFVIMKIDGRSSRKHVLWTRVIDGLGSVGLGVDGSDLSGFPGARTMATPSTRRAFMKPSAADLGLKDAGSSP
jgi:photosystem II stability/assembly factor-like uncharacterized protein